MPTIFRDKVTVDEFVFNDRDNMPLGAEEFGCDIIDGWSSTSEIESLFTPVGSTDGAIPSSFFPANARQITMAGYVEAPDRATRELLEAYVLGTVFKRNKELIVTRYETIPKFVRVRVSGKREILTNITKTGFRWSVPLTAPDPTKYGLDELTGTAGVSGFSSSGLTFPITFPLVFNSSTPTSDNSVNIVNEGNGFSYPNFTLYGPLNKGWYLQNITTSETIRFDVGLIAGDILTIDFRQELALLNGAPVVTTVVGDFWRLIPGSNKIKLFANPDDLAGFKVTAHSSWE